MDGSYAKLPNIADVSIFVIEKEHLIKGKIALSLEFLEVTLLAAGIDFFVAEAVANLKQIEDSPGPRRLTGS